MITELRHAIINRLQPLSDRAKIIGDDTEGETEQAKSNYTIRVGYAGASFNQPENTESVPLQQGDRSFQISVEIRDLRNEDRTIRLLEDIEELMIGYCPCVKGSVGGFYLQSDRFQQNKDGIYYYVINLAISCFLLKG